MSITSPTATSRTATSPTPASANGGLGRPALEAQGLSGVAGGRKSFKKVIKADLVNRVVESADVPRVTAAQAVDAILDGMKSALADGKRIELRGFGVFQVRARKKGMGRNPRTGDEVPIAPGKTVRFKPGKELRDIS